ncbi:MAG: BrnT family toxin [Deltaproteobacteria bacterium]|nr:BrnT family toxin [Deltaproteobacteria bacterium]
MEFEFDEEKSAGNRDKHGIDFVQAQDLWKGPYVEFAARQEYENRFAIIGPREGQLYTCISTLREGRIRIISCRRARKEERKLYEKTIKAATYG